MEQLEASIKTIKACTALIDNASYCASVVFDSRPMLITNIERTISQLNEIIEAMAEE